MGSRVTATVYSAWHNMTHHQFLRTIQTPTTSDNQDEPAPPPAKKARKNSQTTKTPTTAPPTTLSAPSEQATTRIGTVQTLFRKPRRGAALQPTGSLRFTRHTGIDGDASQTPLSGRQVLLHARSGPPNDGAAPKPTPSRPTTAASLPPGKRGENIFVHLDDAAIWPPPSGSVLHLGTTPGNVTLRITFACEPCSGGARRAGVESVAAFRGWREDACRGMLATVVAGGVVAVGDVVSVEMAGGSERPTAVRVRYRPMDGWVRGRMRDFIRQIPRGRVATYGQLAAWAGAKPVGAYVRTIPSILKEERAEEGEKGRMVAPSLLKSDCAHRYHRVVDTKSRVVTKYVPCQVERLREEGVHVSSAGVVPQAAIWMPTHEELFLVSV